MVNEYMAREHTEGYDKFPPASRRLAQTIFPTDGATGLLEGCSILALQRQAEAVILGCRRSQLSHPEEPPGQRRGGQDAKGDSFRESGDE